MRWDEQRPGCTFTRGQDGRNRYGLWSGDLGVTLTVDSQELEKVRRRHEPFFGVLVDVRYRGQGSVDISTETISLQFLKHFKVTQTALDPDDFGEKIQRDADTQDHATAREVEKHPEQKDAKEAYTRAFQKDAAELLEFVSKNSLRPAHLDPGKPEVSGWVLFSTSSRWISNWKKREYFALRFPIQGTVFEFPFQLPPEKGALILRRRE
ncbi:MAG TPA: hypothetical protein VKR60_02325 [Candidatus Sulfotelmatobacter sp.]|nr:hypothetical protein [Candidatus Sulfotelmatobacter sp.]